ncbi:MAG TPA: hypothetical protein VGN56_00485, partial [Candidatus Paceibacterota bacterium]|nr:hypothetical protein [Candidatus Paceibacterota bacterium]
MSFRLLILSIILIAIAALSTAVLTSAVFLQTSLSHLLPAELGPVVSGFHLLLIYQTIGIGILSLVLAAIGFLVMNTLVIAPLRSIIAAVEAFTARSERIVLKENSASPMEIQHLAQVFTSFAENVELAHARDVEVSRIKSDFISTAAHQFRTPLTGIRW